MRRVAVLVVIALAAVACGSEEDQVEQVVREYMSGLARGDGERTCEALARPYRREMLVDVYEGGCEERVERYWEDLDDDERQAFEDTKITKVERRGETRALVRTKSPTPNEDFIGDAAFNMRKSGDGWTIESNNEFEALE